VNSKYGYIIALRNPKTDRKTDKEKHYSTKTTGRNQPHE
jgi:hypothetical protein